MLYKGVVGVNNKVILVSIDGMRPDGFLSCKNTFCDEMMKIGSYVLDAKTVYPSVTLPCHMSMFHSVPPERHGITTNTYTPPVRPVNGIFEQIKAAGGKSSMFYGWHPLRDISRSGSLFTAEYINSYGDEHTDGILTDKALCHIKKYTPDFVFLYMVETDEKGGHDCGWMSETYLSYISCAISNVKRVIDEAGKDYTIIVTADHGGHDRAHGSDADCDMMIPMFFIGKEFECGKKLENVSILDIAPTVADILGIEKCREWEGRSLVCERKA